MTTLRETFSASTYTALEPDAIAPSGFAGSTPAGVPAAFASGLSGGFIGVFVGVFVVVAGVVIVDVAVFVFALPGVLLDT